MGIELDLTVRSLEFKIDERFVDHDKVWMERIDTNFDMYDHVGETTIPLNYDEFSTDNKNAKKILMIPLYQEMQ